MMRFLASAWVIARRDFTATVLSRSFLLFLLGPLIAFGFGGVFGVVGGRSDEIALRPIIAIIGTPAHVAPFRAAYDRTAARLGDKALPQLRIENPTRDSDGQVRALLSQTTNSVSVVLTGLPDAPRLTGPAHQIDQRDDDVQLILDDMATSAALIRAGVPRPTVSIARVTIDPAGGSTSGNRHLIARAGQFLLFFLTMLLAGMLLSNFVEEKSNKVIEILAAAVPIDTIFFGKLAAMLCVSLTGITIWGSILGGGFLAVAQSTGPMPTPALGWPLFVFLGFAYFVMNYLLLGGIFIGIGAQANSVRDVQTISMPITMAQLAIFALASGTVNDPGTGLALFAQILPLSSPLAMMGRAAQESVIWPHLLALAWQILWVFIIIRVAARRFRTGVFKSGVAKKRWFGRAAGPA
jgi:ABC-2 type transport system permease protein